MTDVMEMMVGGGGRDGVRGGSQRRESGDPNPH